METEKLTFHVEKNLRKALRMKAAETGETMSALVNDALRAAFSEDLEDLAAVAKRKKEPRRPFEEVVRSLKKRGLL